jgi:hypothetical protein
MIVILEMDHEMIAKEMMANEMIAKEMMANEMIAKEMMANEMIAKEVRLQLFLLLIALIFKEDSAIMVNHAALFTMKVNVSHLSLESTTNYDLIHSTITTI